MGTSHNEKKKKNANRQLNNMTNLKTIQIPIQVPCCYCYGTECRQQKVYYHSDTAEQMTNIYLGKCQKQQKCIYKKKGYNQCKQGAMSPDNAHMCLRGSGLQATHLEESPITET